MAPPLVLSLDDDRATDPALVGGKAATLARLLAADLRVPDGFCVTTAAYRQLVDDEAIREAVEALESLDPDDATAISTRSERVRELIRDRPVPAAVRREVVEALSAVGAEAYAVRSSATAEDLPTASFAGQHETYLAVRGPDAVLDRVRDCMASLFTDRAVSYRLRNGISHGSVALAVAVQSMVDPAVAGVLFTADPLTGNRHVASIDASFGLGEALVSGAVTADNARVDRRTGEVLEYTVGEKARAVRSRGEGESGTTVVELSAEERERRALADRQLRRLVALGDRLEKLLSGPQDVEWAIVAGDGAAGDPGTTGRGEPDGEVVVLQSRPITSLFPLPEPAPADDDLHGYLSFSHAQAMPEALPPLVVDRWLAFLNQGFAPVSDEAAAGRLAVSAGGRLYVDLTPLLRVGPLRRRLPGRVAAVSEPAADGFRALLDRRGDAFGDTGPLATAAGLVRIVGRNAGTASRLLPRVLGRFVAALVVGPPPPEREREWVERWGRDLAATVEAPDDPADRARAALTGHDFRVVGTGVIPRIGPVLLAGVVAGKALSGLVPDAAEDVDAVGKGLEMELVTRMNGRLGDLADLARRHPEVAAALEDGAAPPDIEGVDGGGPFLAELEAFLDAYGHRATGEIDVSRPRWRDDPAGPLQTVRSSLRAAEAGAHRDHLDTLEWRADEAAERLVRRADTGLLGPLRRRVVAALIRTYRGGIQLREYPKQGIGHLFAAWHDALAAVGAALADEGRLPDPDDVWFLGADELLGAIDGGVAGPPIEVDVGARRRSHERIAGMAAPPLLTSEGEDPTALRRLDVPPGTLLGTPVSSGIVEGPARVVLDPAVTTVEPGEVIVAPSCDPGWTPLFLTAGGLVTEVGGRMTHGAVVAREYGLPAVVSVRDATTEIRTGERVRVDGAAGTVELLDRD